ncbi:hypothetical protein WJX77_006638 [Trebouxia sp. C0004]
MGKLNKYLQEADMLSQLKGTDHVIELLGTAQLFGQVLYDIANGIGGAAKMDIAHRDVDPNIFGHWKGRGHLYNSQLLRIWLAIGTGLDLPALSMVLLAQSCGLHYLCLKEDSTQSAVCWKDLSCNTKDTVELVQRGL